MQTYYQLVFLFSLLLTGVYLVIWRKHFDLHLTLVFILVPVTNLAFLMQSQAQSTEAALSATRFAYLGGCFLQLIIMMTVFAFILNSADPRANWIEQLTNGAAQTAFFIGFNIKLKI